MLIIVNIDVIYILIIIEIVIFKIKLLFFGGYIEY